MPGGFDDEHSGLTAAEARAVRTVPLYWLGESFEGLPLTVILGGRGGASFVYGTCAPPPGGDGGCALVLLSRGIEVRVFAGGGQGLRAIDAMRAINPEAPGAVGAGEPPPSPPDGAEQRIPCSAIRRRLAA